MLNLKNKAFFLFLSCLNYPLIYVFASHRVQMQKMEIVRPPADVARYTMVFHKRDAGNKVNKDRLGRLGPG